MFPCAYNLKGIEMFKITKKSIMWGGRKLTLETGRIARQADGAVLATYGETSVLCTVVAAKEDKLGQGFFPLTVHYLEKAFAAGKIPGSFFRRESKPSEYEVLTSRLIDRPIRPIFAENFMRDTQVVCTLFSHDMENQPDVLSIIGASAALTISGIPFLGPIAAARVGYQDGKYLLNPSFAEVKESELDLVVAGTGDSVLMVESEASELSEEIMLGAVEFGHAEMKKIVEFIVQFAEACAKDPWDLPTDALGEETYSKMAALAEKDLREAYSVREKQARHEKIKAVKQKALEQMVSETLTAEYLSEVFHKLEANIVRGNILKNGTRIDGRDSSTIRQIETEAGFLARTHGSALFTRGETQAIVVATLGTSEDEQIVDSLGNEAREHFLLHYNFPPYSVGETGRMGAPGRREIGHGKLAWRALHPLMPSKDDFPYTIRVVSEITESNGSSSMATVCGSSMALMDAGVPLPRPIAGIAMGLIKEGEQFAILSDIMGDEDHLGDMDFKVAGTDQGITALQMDIKIRGITLEIMKKALAQAKNGRLHILSEMAKTITGTRGEISRNAPRITTIQIPKEKIREVIGSGGKVIREICEKSGAKVDIEDSGVIHIAAVDESAGALALKMINDIVVEPELGRIYEGVVARILDFGAVVNFLGSRDGLVHISELADYRVGTVNEIVNEGDKVKVKVIEIDRTGKTRLSMKAVNQETGEDNPDYEMRERPPRDRDNRGERDRGDDRKRRGGGRR